MAAVGWENICKFALLAYFMLSHFSLATSVRVDLTQLRNQVSKIKVNPRGNLWATGHFMGKKSVANDSLLESANKAAASGAVRPHADPRLLRGKLRFAGRDGAGSSGLETDLLMKRLRSIVWDRRT